MKDNNIKYHWLLIVILSALLMSIVAMTWHFSSQSGQISHSISKSIANSFENSVAEIYIINPADYFWRYNIDELIRKGAHLVVYFLFGLITCALFNAVISRLSLATGFSLLVCSFYAYIDEYRQNFSIQRIPSWFDWKLDVAGTLMGILMATMVFVILRYIHRLKARINELEECQGNLASDDQRK